MESTRKRWYDKNPKLAHQLDRLMNVHPKDELKVLEGLLALIRETDQDILIQFMIPSDIEEWDRRWYDKDPVYWLAINGLKHAGDELLDRVADFLAAKLPAQ